jgi:hypothetical protein
MSVSIFVLGFKDKELNSFVPLQAFPSRNDLDSAMSFLKDVFEYKIKYFSLSNNLFCRLTEQGYYVVSFPDDESCHEDLAQAKKIYSYKDFGYYEVPFGYKPVQYASLEAAKLVLTRALKK